jgi:acyl-CoA synthetase (AMP-forming)/AMP-acid ligase II
VDGSRRLDWRAAQREVHAIAGALAREPGLAPGAHVAIMSPNDGRVMLLQLAASRADLAWVSIQTRNTVETNARVLEHFDADLLFFHSELQGAIPALRRAVPRLRRFVCIDRESPEGESLEGWSARAPLPAGAGAGRPWSAGREAPDAAAFLAPTGGETGPCRGPLHTNRALEMCALNTALALGAAPDSRHLVVAPLSHAAGLMALAFVVHGGANVVLPGFEEDAVLDAIEREGITHLFLPPTALYALLAHPRTASANLRSLRCLLVGGAPTDPARFQEAVRVLGPVVHEAYGQMETLIPLLVKAPADYLRPDGSCDELALRSAGRPSLLARVELMDDDGALVPPGERGEIVVQSSMVMQGYYRSPEATAAVSRFGWHHTSDVAVRDERGFLTIVDRKRELIISGGFNLHPAEIATVIYGHPAVRDCVVVGVPDPKWGEAVKAVIELLPGAAATEAELVALCREKLGAMKAPKTVEFWPSLPRNAAGEVLRAEVRRTFWQGQWRSV